MPSIKQSLCLGLYCKKDMNLDDFICRVKQMGFAAVEIWQVHRVAPGVEARSRPGPARVTVTREPTTFPAGER